MSTLLPAPPVVADEGNLPGGTSVTVELTEPGEAAVIPAGAPSLAVAGTASIGQGPTIANTLIVYVLDVSGSVNTVGEGCGGDANGDGRSNTVLDCEIVAAQAVNADARLAGSVGEVGVVTFSGYSQVVTNPPAAAVMGDLSPAAGVQTLVPPGADVDGLNGADVEEALASALVRNSGGVNFYGLRKFTSLSAGQGSTDYHDGIEAALQLVNASTMSNKLVIFMSDGASTTGENVSTLQGAVAAGGAVIHSFAVGSDTGFDCTTNNRARQPQRCGQSLHAGGHLYRRGLARGSAQHHPRLIQAQLTGLSYTMDDGAPQDLSSVVTPALPQIGPAGVSFSTALPLPAPGSHTLCVRADGSDAGGSGSVSQCTTFTVNGAPAATDDQLTTGEDNALVLPLPGLLDNDSDPNGDALTAQLATAPSFGTVALRAGRRVGLHARATLPASTPSPTHRAGCLRSHIPGGDGHGDGHTRRVPGSDQSLRCRAGIAARDHGAGQRRPRGGHHHLRYHRRHMWQ
ncbi:MAG: Ig-like domain-containing protein [Caldilineaceae bacterium]